MSAMGKRIAKIFGVVIIILLILCIIVWRMFAYTPAVYQPAAPQDSAQVSPYLTHKLAPDIYNNIQLNEPFCVLVEQTGINDIVARWPWPMQLDGAAISTPLIIFQPDTIILMGTVKFDNFAKYPVVVTIIFTPKLDEKGMLTLNLRHVKAGAFNITPLARSITAKVIQNELQAAEQSDTNRWLVDLRDALLENKPFDPVFPVYEDFIRVGRIELIDRQLTLLFTPVKQ